MITIWGFVNPVLVKKAVLVVSQAKKTRYEMNKIYSNQKAVYALQISHY